MRWLLAALVLAAAAPAPEETDARAQAVARSLRCLVCQNQSVAESDAPLAQDMRRLVRARIEAGDSDAEARAFVVDRYGEVVLLRPRLSPRNALLWTAPALVLVLGAAGAVLFVRGQRTAPAPLTDEERAELERLRA